MKNNKLLISFIAIFVLLAGGFIYWQLTKKEPIDWNPTFQNKDKIPHGTYIAYQLLPDVFPNQKIESTRRPIYNNVNDLNYVYDDEYPENDTVKVKYNHQQTSYIFINLNFNIDQLDLDYLLDFVYFGNDAFISAEIFAPGLLDSLGIKTKSTYLKPDTIFGLNDFPEKKYTFDKLYQELAFKADSSIYPIKVLAQNSRKDTVFIEVKYGDGHFYLHTLPAAFSNISLIDLNKYDFAFRSLSYLPKNSNVIWDEYQKQGVVGERNMLRVIFSHPSLLVAFIITIIGTILFMIFRSKRIQRIIPVIKPLQNSSLEFLETISNLYYGKRDYKAIVEKRFYYFLDFVRTQYYLNTEHINNEFVTSLSLKSGVDIAILESLFDQYKRIKDSPHLMLNTEFLDFNNVLEEFYRAVKNKN